MTSNISLEHTRSLESENVSLESEGVQLENEKQKLQQKLKVMTELYQENEMKLHRWDVFSDSIRWHGKWLSSLSHVQGLKHVLIGPYYSIASFTFKNVLSS